MSTCIGAARPGASDIPRVTFLLLRRQKTRVIRSEGSNLYSYDTKSVDEAEPTKSEYC